MKSIKLTVTPDFMLEEEQYRQEIELQNKASDVNIHCLRSEEELESSLERLIPSHQGDLWEPQMLGVEVPEGSINQHFSFMRIEQHWLKCLVKLYVKYSAAHRTFRTIHTHICSLAKFSQYLAMEHPFCRSLEYIDRGIILSFIRHLKESGLQDRTISCHLSGLTAFFRAGQLNHWFSCPANLITKEDYPKIKHSLPRYIPETVLTQLNAHLEHLPEPVMRMVLILQECGIRIGELVALQRDCLYQDHQGDWFISFTREKVKAEHRLPISKELAAVIQEQQQYIQEHFQEGYDYLFCSNTSKRSSQFVPEPRPMGLGRLAVYLNRLAKNFEIKDDAGHLWRFQTHQFRHTVGTRMVNNGVPLHIIQRYLGHASPQMTQTYARIHDQTLKAEFLKFQSKVVTITGEVVQESSSESADGELDWMRKNILSQALPNGSCARPVLLGPCPHANACLTCADFRTTAEFLAQHEAQLAQTQNIIEQAKAKGWQRQVEMNEAVAENLSNIIHALRAKP